MWPAAASISPPCLPHFCTIWPTMNSNHIIKTYRYKTELKLLLRWQKLFSFFVFCPLLLFPGYCLRSRPPNALSIDFARDFHSYSPTSEDLECGPLLGTLVQSNDVWTMKYLSTIKHIVGNIKELTVSD